MRKLALPIFVLGLAAVSGTWAAGGPGDAAPPASDKAATTPSANLPDAPKAASTTATAPAAPAPATAATPALESQLAELRALLHAQAAEIEAQRHELAAMKAKLGDVKEEAVSAAVSAAVPAATLAVTSSDAQEKKEGPPTAIHYKGITITPGGFLAAETVFRNRAVSSDVNTSFTSVPFSGSNLSKISEWNASGRQSRLTLLAQGKLSSATLTGYYEGDFLSAGTTSNDNQSNSFTFRQRQAWAAAVLDSGWGLSGGQMWSLVTEQKEGLNNRTSKNAENANVPLTIDAQYTAGFTWARQYGFRVVKSLYDKKFWLGFSVEEAQTKFTAHNQNNNFVLQAPGQAGGLYNVVSAVSATGVASPQNYTLNAAPDFILKAAFDPGGSWGHYELFGVIRTFRDRVYPCATASVAVPCPVDATITAPSALHASNDKRAGGFGGINIRVPVFNKKLDVGFHGLYGDGVGRYGTIGFVDTTVRPNGTLAPVRGGQGLGTLEWHATPKLDVYAYAGAEYVARTVFQTVAQTATVPGVKVGYGSPFLNVSGCTAVPEVLPTAGGLPSSAAACTADPRRLIQGTFGYWYRWYKGDKGTIQTGMQYSYYVLNAWSGTTGSAVTGSQQFHPAANNNMFFTSFRYYLP